MNALTKRVAKLEGASGEEDLVVLLHSWIGTGEYFGLKRGDNLIRRAPQETERVFLDRAESELVAIAKRNGHRGPITCSAIRQSVMPD